MYCMMKKPVDFIILSGCHKGGIMKKNIIFACLAILLYVYSLNTKTMAVDNKYVSSEKVVDAFDKYFSDNGIDMYEEIGKMVFEYEKIAKEGDLMQRSKANNIISTLLDLEKSVLIDTKSGEDRYQNPENIVILYAIAYFNVINCDLAAELLSYAYYNHTLNVVYTPLNGNIVEQSLLVQNIAEGMNTITGSNEFNYDPTDDVSKDLYYSIKQFEYEKKYYDSDEITFHLRDRYDFDQDHNSYDSLLNLAVGTMHAYQQLGLLTPFIVDISVVIEGTVLFSYEIDDDYATIDYVPGYTANLIIPNSILDINSYVDDNCSDSVDIVSIGNLAAYNCTNLLSICLPSSLTEIRVSAFKGCTALTSITIPSSVTNINSYAFEDCTSLSSITLNSGLTFLGSSVFKGCSSLYSISIPSGVSIINPNAFENCTNLHSITLSNNLTTISNAAFKRCTSLTSISIPSTVTSIGDDAFKNCSALTSVVVGRNAAPITTLGSNAFSGCPSSLQITAPQNRVGDYKNDINWFAHRNKIPFNPNSYYAYYVNNASNINITNNISAGYNIVYKLIVSDTNTYKIESSSTYNVMLKIYDSNMMLLNSNANILSQYLTSGSTYYLSIEFNNASFSGTISTNIIQDSNHYHNYSYSWNSYINHRKYCACGNSSLKAHVVSPDAFNNGQQYAECTLCHGLASIGANPMSQNNYPYTLNGSFILPNGVIVLVEEDYEAYMNDTLVFINPNDNIDRGNTFIPCLIRKEDNYWINVS